MDPKEYGDEYKQHLLEQYKLYVQMADKISDRRDKSNTFYTTLLVGLFAVISIAVTAWGASGLLSTLLMGSIGLIGFLLCVVWCFNIRSYKQLNTGKFKVIHVMEQELPFCCYDEEWEMLGRGEDRSKYWPFTHVERFIPIIMAIPYFLLVGYSGCRLIVDGTMFLVDKL